MKINYIPGLALRFFPGVSREPYDAFTSYTSEAKISIYTGTAPTENELWNLTDYEAFKISNADNLVYTETTQLLFTYDSFKHKRVIQRMPIDSLRFTPLVDHSVQDTTDEETIVTDNSMYALIYCPDKDTTLNTADNDLIMLIPNVGSGPDDFMSVSKVNFTTADEVDLRNLTVALFQGYQITDSQIIEEIEDPENPGSTIPTIVDTKKSIYYNKIWGNKVSESYRDCFISRNAQTKLVSYNASNQLQALKTATNYYGELTQPFSTCYNSINGISFSLRKYDTVNNNWSDAQFWASNGTLNTVTKYAFVVNQAVIDLIDEINLRGQLGSLPSVAELFTAAAGSFVLADQTPKFITQHANSNSPSTMTQLSTKTNLDVISGTLVKYLINQVWFSDDIAISYTNMMIELGFDESLVIRAVKSIMPFDLDISKWVTTFEKDSAILTVQNLSPAKMYKRYKKSVNNPTNEQLYILLPRYLNRTAINTSVYGDLDNLFVDQASTVFPVTQTVIDGEVTDTSSKMIRVNDYTAISVGLTGNGKTDIEYDILDTIDYIDSFTAMVKIPNKF